MHLNNAGAALPPAPVLNAVVDHLRREAEIGGYEAAAERLGRIEHAYDALARLLGCERDEVALVENATRAWDMAFYAFSFVPDDRILTTRAEYASNYIALSQVAGRTGAVVEVVPDDEHGQVDTRALHSMLDERVKLVSLVHVPTQGGLVNPAAEVGAITRAAGIPLLLDACQSVGQMPVDVGEIGCDILSATGRKFLRGPRGTGFLYMRRELIEQLEPPFLDLHAAEWLPGGGYEVRGDARRFENWESYCAGKIGLGVAVDYALEWGLQAIRDRVCSLAALLRERLGTVEGVAVHDLGRERCAIVTFTVAGIEPEAVARALSAERINVSVSPGSSSRLDLDARGLDALVRASVHYYNTEEELERMVELLRTRAAWPLRP
ncbi:MAG TPA: aminotransferase class V-fold PLP-dependent enzyme [Solirubrobacteraceae bacterium]|nr:aminotransferase class V-fold PLP-dependent enzyme [Solirubrobacteraceae bacterium]